MDRMATSLIFLCGKCYFNLICKMHQRIFPLWMMSNLFSNHINDHINNILLSMCFVYIY